MTSLLIGLILQIILFFDAFVSTYEAISKQYFSLKVSLSYSIELSF